MGNSFNTAFALTTALIDRSKKKKTIQRIQKLNESTRNVQRLGHVSCNQLIPSNSQMGNIIISGGTEDHRNKLLVENCRQSVSIGLPTIVIHENNYQLEALLKREFSGHCYVRIINPANPYYDPILRLTDTEIGHFVIGGAPMNHSIPSEGALYVKALVNILRKKNISPYLRMMASCPHNSIQTILVEMEQSGVLSKNEVDSIRNDINIGKTARAEIEYFFQQIEMESAILPGKRDLSKTTSITEAVKNKGILSLDISSTAKKNQLAMIVAEINNCAKLGNPFRMIIDAACIANNSELVDILKNSTSISWTISSSDVHRMLGQKDGELAFWLAISHRAILFAHSIKTSELLSAELGEYEHIDITESATGTNSIGKFGYHFGTNSSFSTSSKRERVVKSEEIANFRENEFLLLDNYTSSVSNGILS